MTLGVISDTHNFFDPKIPDLLKGVDHILHGGDIGTPKILLQLEQIAPVSAVAGNTDDLGFRYRQTEVLSLGDLKFLIHHIVNPFELDDSFKGRLARERPDAVVFGHTHKPFSQDLGGILFFNPGYAGKSRFGMQRTLALLHCNGKRIRPEYFTL
jgi:putative phosphoesterase